MLDQASLVVHRVSQLPAAVHYFVTVAMLRIFHMSEAKGDSEKCTLGTRCRMLEAVSSAETPELHRWAGFSVRLVEERQ